jgi:hypothetical protein
MRLCEKDLLQNQAAKTKEDATRPIRSPVINTLGHLLQSPSHMAQNSLVSATTIYLLQQQQQQERHDWVALATLMAERRQHKDCIQQLQNDLRIVQQLNTVHQSNMALLSPLSLMDRGIPHHFTEEMHRRRGGLQNWFALDAPQPDATLMLSNPMPSSSTSFWNHYSMTSQPNNSGNTKTMPLSLPVNLARPVDALKLSDHQFFLRQQIEVFQASPDDVSTHIRGRNKPIGLGQVGIRCRHCAHLPIYKRQKGSTYFPANKLGIYQAAQNMCTTHIQCGLCLEMPESIKLEFVRLLVEKGQNCHTGAGRPYWAKSATELGLVDTEDMGVRFIRDLPSGAMIPLG